MDFGDALRALKSGQSVARHGWNGKGMFLYLVKSDAYPPRTDIAKKHWEGKNVPYRAYIAMKTVGDEVVPWVASQSDLIEMDWVVLEN